MQNKLVAVGVLMASLIVGAKDMPSLKWMEDDKARNAVSNVTTMICGICVLDGR